jgi:hypothetical protein
MELTHGTWRFRVHTYILLLVFKGYEDQALTLSNKMFGFFHILFEFEQFYLIWHYFLQRYHVLGFMLKVSMCIIFALCLF